MLSLVEFSKRAPSLINAGGDLPNKKRKLPSLVDLCAWVDPYLPSALISDFYKRNFQKCAALFPLSLAQDLECLVFECDIKEKTKRGDFMFMFHLPSMGLLDLQKSFEKSPFRQKDGWKTVLHHYKTWIEENFFAKNQIDAGWIELDTGSSALWPPEPNFFLYLNDSARENKLLISQQMIHRLTCSSFSSKTFNRVQQCEDAGYRLFCIGFMQSRVSQPIRLCLCCTELGSFFTSPLIDLGCSHSFISLLKSLSSFFCQINLHIDVIDDHISPRIGIDCLVEKSKVVNKMETWIQLLDICVERNFIDRNKQSALISWAKNRFFTKYLSISNSIFECVLSTNIHYIKFIYTPQNSIQTKAYLSLWNY